jgi:hypothetical protein
MRKETRLSTLSWTLGKENNTCDKKKPTRKEKRR